MRAVREVLHRPHPVPRSVHRDHAVVPGVHPVLFAQFEARAVEEDSVMAKDTLVVDILALIADDEDDVEEAA